MPIFADFCHIEGSDGKYPPVACSPQGAGSRSLIDSTVGLYYRLLRREANWPGGMSIGMSIKERTPGIAQEDVGWVRMINGKVFVTREVHLDAIDLLRGEFTTVDVWPRPLPPTPEQLAAKAPGRVAMVTMLTNRVDATLLDAAPMLKVVSNMAVGYDNFDLAEAARRGVVLANTPGVLTEATADLAFALLLAVARRVAEAAQDAKAGKWGPWHPQAWVGHDVYGRTLGVVGLGRIGLAVAKRARGFDMRVLYHARNRRERNEEAELDLTYATLDRLLAEADSVSLHVPLTPETHHFIGRRELEYMKTSADRGAGVGDYCGRRVGRDDAGAAAAGPPAVQAAQCGYHAAHRQRATSSPPAPAHLCQQPSRRRSSLASICGESALPSSPPTRVDDVVHRRRFREQRLWTYRPRGSPRTPGWNDEATQSTRLITATASFVLLWPRPLLTRSKNSGGISGPISPKYQKGEPMRTRSTLVSRARLPCLGCPSRTRTKCPWSLK